MVQLALPSSDILKGNWEGFPDSVNFYKNIDEVAADDSDYLDNPDDVPASTYKAGLSAVTDPGVDTDHILRWRFYKLGGRVVNIRLELYVGVTFILARQKNFISTTVTEDDYELLTTEASQITDYTNLHIQLTSTFSGTPLGADAICTWVQFEIPGLLPPPPVPPTPPVTNKGSEEVRRVTDDYGFQESLPGWDQF